MAIIELKKGIRLTHAITFHFFKRWQDLSVGEGLLFWKCKAGIPEVSSISML
jgi:hypothetical protein